MKLRETDFSRGWYCPCCIVTRLTKLAGHLAKLVLSIKASFANKGDNKQFGSKILGIIQAFEKYKGVPCQ